MSRAGVKEVGESGGWGCTGLQLYIYHAGIQHCAEKSWWHAHRPPATSWRAAPNARIIPQTRSRREFPREDDTGGFSRDTSKQFPDGTYFSPFFLILCRAGRLECLLSYFSRVGGGLGEIRGLKFRTLKIWKFEELKIWKVFVKMQGVSLWHFTYYFLELFFILFFNFFYFLFFKSLVVSNRNIKREGKWNLVNQSSMH